MPDIHVSICVPCRNGANELPHTLANLTKLRYPASSLQILIGDHGSEDGTAEYIAHCAKTHSHVRRVAVPFDGPNRARVRNTLLEAAAGELVIFIDHDVLVSTQFVHEHLAAHLRYPRALVAGQTYGKGPYRQEIQDLLAELELDDISASEAQLRSRPNFADTRTAKIPNLGSEATSVTALVAPPRLFWSCNISFMASALTVTGRFDERYTGWGVEDDDFAHGFYVNGFDMVFAPGAWGFHLPHPADRLEQQLSRRRNASYLYSKYPSRELEYFQLFPAAPAGVAEYLEAAIPYAAAVDTASLMRELSAVPKPGRRRLVVFALDPRIGEMLSATDVCSPTLPLKARGERHANVHLWPLFGAKLPFPSRTFADVVVVADHLMFIEDLGLGLLLLEIARVADTVVVGMGEACLEPSRAFLVHAFLDKLTSLDASRITVLGAGAKLASAYQRVATDTRRTLE